MSATVTESRFMTLEEDQAYRESLAILRVVRDLKDAILTLGTARVQQRDGVAEGEGEADLLFCRIAVENAIARLNEVTS